MQTLIDYLPAIAFVVAIIAVIALRLYLRSAALRRTWTEAARLLGCTFEPNPITGQESVGGTYRGHKLTIDTDGDYALTRVAVGCANSTGLRLAIMSAVEMRAGEHLESRSRGVDFDGASPRPVVTFPAFADAQDIEIGDAGFDQRFVVRSTATPHIAAELARVAAWADRESGGALLRDLSSLTIDGDRIVVVLGRLATKPGDEKLLRRLADLSAELADQVASVRA